MIGRIVIGAALLGAAFIVLVVRAYRRDNREAVARVLAGSQVVDTRVGPVEYAVQGEGPAVMILHGIGGGYDQGLLIAHLLRGQGFKIIAVSRPGYLRTPLEVGVTNEAQADACAALLDALNIASVTVMGASAGGPRAVQFALRHAKRCRALIMISAASRPLDVPQRLVMLVKLIIASDFIPWLMMTLGERQAIEANGKLEPEVWQDEEKMAILREMVRMSATGSLRGAGMFNDIDQNEASSGLQLESVAVPTLVIHGTDDPIVPFSVGQHAAENVPGAKFVVVEGGGHLCLWTHHEQTTPLLVEFLKANVS